MSYVALYSVYQTHLLYYRCIKEKNKSERENKCDVSANKKNKSEGQPCAKEAQSDCRMRAAESFCGIEQTTPV